MRITNKWRNVRSKREEFRPLNVGIIGCGDVTEVKSGPAFQKILGSNLAYVMRRDEEKLKDYARRHGVEKYSTNYKDLLEDEDLDLIYIATPPHMHRFYTEQAAKAKKHVYVEKPMALTVKECEEMVEISKKEGVKLFVAYYRRGQEKFTSTKTIIENEIIGEIRSFQLLYTSTIPTFDPNRPWIYDEKVSGGGKFYDVGSHMIDLLLYLFGDVSYAKGISSNQSHAFDVSDVTSGIITFKNGVQGTVQMNFNAMENRDELLIIGSEGSITLSMMDLEEVHINLADKGEEVNIFPSLDHVQMPMISDVIDTINGVEILYPLDDTGTYGLRTQEILETFRDSKEISY